MRFLCGFPDRFKTGHEVWNDLNHQESRYQGRVSEEWRDICRRTPAYADSHKDHEKGKRAETGPVLKSRAEAHAPIIQDRKKSGEPKSNHKMWEIHGVAAYAVEFDGIDCRDDIRGHATHGNGLPRTNDEIG